MRPPSIILGDEGGEAFVADCETKLEELEAQMTALTLERAELLQKQKAALDKFDLKFLKLEQEMAKLEGKFL